MKKIIVILLSVIMLFTSCTQNIESTQNNNSENIIKVSQEDIDKRLEDLEFVCDYLNKRHVNPYFYISEENFLGEKQKIIDKLPNISQKDFHLELTKLIASLGDVHTKITLEDYDYFKNEIDRLQILFLNFVNNYYLVATSEKNKQYIGYKLSAINDTPIDEVVKKLKTLNSYETEEGSNNNLSTMLNMTYILQFLNIIEDSSSVTYTLENPETNNHKKLTLTNKNDYYNENEITIIDRKSIPTKTDRDKYYLSYGLTPDTYYIQYNTCNMISNYSVPNFESDVKKDIESNKYNNIIIDLRNNGGGAQTMFDDVIAMIKEYQQKENCKIYCLINGFTISSGSMTAMEIKTELDCKMVGTETGGVINCYGAANHLKLPNSPLTFICATNSFGRLLPAMKPNYATHEGSIKPDIEIRQTLQDYINGIDTVVEAVVKME